MQIVYMATAGEGDADRASIPVHLAVNGSAEVGQEPVLVLAGDATGLLKGRVADGVTGLGVPPLRELLDKVIAKGVDVLVCKACAVARGVTDDDLSPLAAKWTTAPEVAQLFADADKVVVF